MSASEVERSIHSLLRVKFIQVQNLIEMLGFCITRRLNKNTNISELTILLLAENIKVTNKYERLS